MAQRAQKTSQEGRFMQLSSAVASFGGNGGDTVTGGDTIKEAPDKECGGFVIDNG
ncbi:MAG: hypothetical protein ACI4BC_01360 [Muribaculaceae bacterium]